MKILVTGGTGYIGSHTVHQLIKNGEVIMMNEEDFDNFIYNVINSQKENNTERIVEEVLKKSLINFLYLYKKIKKMVEESK